MHFPSRARAVDHRVGFGPAICAQLVRARPLLLLEALQPGAKLLDKARHATNLRLKLRLGKHVLRGVGLSDSLHHG